MCKSSIPLSSQPYPNQNENILAGQDRKEDRLEGPKHTKSWVVFTPSSPYIFSARMVPFLRLLVKYYGILFLEH